MIEERESQTAILELSYSFWAAVLDLIANGFGQTLRIYAESYTIEEIFLDTGMDKHRFRVIEYRLHVGIEMYQ